MSLAKDSMIARCPPTVLSSHRSGLVFSPPSPIFNLPVEILCRIFRTLRSSPDSMSDIRNPREIQRSNIAWIAVSWVCRHWRSVALNDPLLWTEIPLDTPSLAMEMLERSKNAGLVIDLHEDLSDLLLSKVFGQLYRIVELKVQNQVYGRRSLKKLVERVSLRSTPRLQSLNLSNVDWLPSGTNNICLPDELFADARHLHCLSLVNMVVNWRSHLFSRALKELRIEQIYPLYKPTFRDIWTIMSQNSATLQSLTMRDALPRKGFKQSLETNTPPILMSALERLTLDEVASDIMMLLRIIHLTDRARYANICIFLADFDAQDFVDMLGCIGRREALGGIVLNAKSAMIHGIVAGAEVGQWRRFELTLNTFNNSVLNGILPTDFDNDARAIDRKVPGVDLNIHSLYLDGDDSSLTFRCVFTDLFNTFRWENLVNLSLKEFRIIKYFDFGQVLARTFGTLPRLELVEVGPGGVDHLIDALNPSPPACDQEQPKIAFGALSQVSMVDVDISSRSRMDKLRICLLGRRKLGFPIARINLVDCRGEDRHLTLVKKLVDIAR